MNIKDKMQYNRGMNNVPKLQKFANVNGVDVLLDPGTMSFEPCLFFVDEDGKNVEFTRPSNEYENLTGEFMMNRLIAANYKIVGEIVDELSDEIDVLTNVTIFTLKDEYKDKLLKAIE